MTRRIARNFYLKHKRTNRISKSWKNMISVNIEPYIARKVRSWAYICRFFNSAEEVLDYLHPPMYRNFEVEVSDTVANLITNCPHDITDKR